MGFPRTFALLLTLLALPMARAEFDPLGTAADTPARPGVPGMNKPCEAMPEGPLSLADAVETALCHNPQTREVWANARYQAALLGVARAAYLPTLDGKLTSANKDTSTGAAYRQDTGSLTLSWLLYDFGGRRASLENATALLEAAAATQDDKVQALFLGTVQAYYQVQASEAALDAARVSEKAAGESFRAAEARYQAGMVTPADKLQAQTAWSQAQLAVQQAYANWQMAKGNLAALLGREATRSPALSTPLAVGLPPAFEQAVDALIVAARARRADLRAAEAQVRGARAAAEVARATGRPSLSLAAVGSKDHLEHNAWTTGSSVGVSLTWPLFSGFNTTYKVQAAEAQVDTRLAQRDRIALQVAQDVWNAYQNLVSTGQSLRTTQDLLASAEAAEAMARGRYKAGVGSILDLLTTQTALASARQQQVQAAYNWNLYRATLAQAMGALDEGFLTEITRSPGSPGPALPREK